MLEADAKRAEGAGERVGFAAAEPRSEPDRRSARLVDIEVRQTPACLALKIADDLMARGHFGNASLGLAIRLLIRHLLRRAESQDQKVKTMRGQLTKKQKQINELTARVEVLERIISDRKRVYGRPEV